MSEHKRALVPLESWSYNSPELLMTGKSVDIGLLLEALIYYDSIIVNVGNQPQFAELLKWFIAQERLPDFLALIQDGTIGIYDYSFMTTAIHDERTGTYSIWNLQDPIQAQADSFEQRYLGHKSVLDLFSHARHREKVYRALRGHVIEAKADQFGSALENARSDYAAPQRNEIIVQSFVDELYACCRLGRPPQVTASVSPSDDGSTHNIQWNVDFRQLSAAAGKDLNFNQGTPLTAGAISNRLIWSAQELDCDLYVGSPMGTLIGDKLYESIDVLQRPHEVVDSLKQAVEFPDVRKLVNEGKLTFDDVLLIRKKAQRFRHWLQCEAGHDRDAIIAYHNEVATEIGFVRGARKSLSLFGLIGVPAIGGAVGALMTGPGGAAIGGVLGSGGGYLLDVASKIGAGWKPVVFGNWMRGRIAQFNNGKGRG